MIRGGVRCRGYLLACMVCLTASQSFSQTRPFGLGGIGGEPCGLTMKVWFNPYIAMDLAAGADFGVPSRNLFRYDVPPAFQTHLEFLAHIPLLRSRAIRMPVYVGAGAKLSWHAGFEGVRARTPLGVEFLLPRKPWPWEIFFEFAPTWGAYPLNFDPDAAMGVRYYF